MPVRHIALGLVVVVAAFLVAFGIGKATNGDDAAGTPARAEAIEAGEAAVPASVPARAKLSELERERRRASSGGSSSGGASSGSSGPPAEQPADPESANPSPPQSGSGGGSGAVTGGGVN